MKPLPCPFCGATPKLRLRATGAMVMCEASACPVNPATDAITRTEAIALWNKRVPWKVEEIDLTEVPLG